MDLDTLRTKFADTSHVICRLPGGDAVDFTAGLGWIETMVRQGYSISHFVTGERDKPVIWLKAWRTGGPEPDWR